MMKTMFVDGSTSFGSCQYVPACTEWETLLRHSGSSRGICGRRLRRRGDTATFINRVYTALIVSSLKNNLNVHGIWVVSPPGIDNTGSCTTSALCVYTLWDFETLTSASELEILYIFKRDFLFFLLLGDFVEFNRATSAKKMMWLCAISLPSLHCACTKPSSRVPLNTNIIISGGK